MRKYHPKQSHRVNRLAASLLVGLWALAPGWVNALPSDGKIVAGSGSIQQPSKQDLVVQQDSQQLITNWQSFSIGATESVTFKQPDSSAIALNRVIGVDPSIILGKLSANGQVFLTNPSGVLFGKGSVVDVHGLLATTLNISDKDFLNGNYQFSQDPYQALTKIMNEGTIKAVRYAGLLAPEVETNGTIIVADLGSIALASGTMATLDFNGDGLISFAVADADVKVLNGRINNSKLIRANEGQVLLTSKSVGDVIGNVVNHSGLIEAQTVQQKGGKIILSAKNPGTVKLSGTLDAPDIFVTGEVVAVAANDFLSTNNGNINFLAKDLDLRGDLDSGTGDVAFTLANGGDLEIKSGNNPGRGVGANDIKHITAENLKIKTGGNINVTGITEEETDGITDTVILMSGGDITFEQTASAFPALNLMAVNDINVNADVTTTKGDFIAKADNEGNGKGDFNLASGAVVKSARDIDISAPNINAEESSFSETRNLILNGNVTGGSSPQPSFDSNSVQQGSLSAFLTEFFENGGAGGC